MIYEDLDLRFTADGTGIAVSIDGGPQLVRQPLELPAAWDFSDPQARSAQDARAIGILLFDSIFRGGIGNLYHQARGRIRGHVNRGLLLRIHLDPKEPRLAALHHLPWEMLFDREHGAGQHLALNPQTVIVRTIESSVETRVIAADRRPRVLVASANPRDTEALDLQREEQNIERALGRLGLVPTVLRGATRVRLADFIRDHNFDIVHFMGHGDYHGMAEEAGLILEAEDGLSEAMSAEQLAGLFAGRAVPRLVVLNACHSAGSRRSGTGVFSSVAGALVVGGLPAVLAMQTLVPDDSAVRFTDRLYRRLGLGDRVEAAVAEARISLSTIAHDTVDWAIPVLFARASRVDASQAATLSAGPRPEDRNTETARTPTNTILGDQHNGDHVEGHKVTVIVNPPMNYGPTRRREE
jgi:hypothetical protein